MPSSAIFWIALCLSASPRSFLNTIAALALAAKYRYVVLHATWGPFHLQISPWFAKSSSAPAIAASCGSCCFNFASLHGWRRMRPRNRRWDAKALRGWPCFGFGFSAWLGTEHPRLTEFTVPIRTLYQSSGLILQFPWCNTYYTHHSHHYNILHDITRLCPVPAQQNPSPSRASLCLPWPSARPARKLGDMTWHRTDQNGLDQCHIEAVPGPDHAASLVRFSSSSCAATCSFSWAISCSTGLSQSDICTMSSTDIYKCFYPLSMWFALRLLSLFFIHGRKLLPLLTQSTQLCNYLSLSEFIWPGPARKQRWSPGVEMCRQDIHRTAPWGRDSWLRALLLTLSAALGWFHSSSLPVTAG